MHEKYDPQDKGISKASMYRSANASTGSCASIIGVQSPTEMDGAVHTLTMNTEKGRGPQASCRAAPGSSFAMVLHAPARKACCDDPCLQHGAKLLGGRRHITQVRVRCTRFDLHGVTVHAIRLRWRKLAACA